MNEAKVRLRLDTGMALSQMRRVVREGRETANRVSRTIDSTVGQGLRTVGLGGGIGVGLAAARAATSSGYSDIVSETFSPIGASLQDFILGDMPADARASKSAREETIQTFGFLAGATNSIPPGAKSFFEQTKSLRMNEELGRKKFMENSEFFGGVKMDNVIDRLVDGIGGYLNDGFDALKNSIPFLGR